VLLLALACALAYLRDPPWLAHVTTGLGALSQDERGVFYRWAGARASLFFPSDADSLEVPVRAVFRGDDRSPFIVSFAVDGQPAGRVVLSDGAWLRVRLDVPSGRSRRRVRRLDVAVNRTAGDLDHGVMVGLVAPVRR
jgi:hypothetical protein